MGGIQLLGVKRVVESLEHIALFLREKVDGFPMFFPATTTALKSESLYIEGRVRDITIGSGDFP